METSGSPRVRLKPTVSAPMASIARNPNLRSARENRAIASRPAKKLTKIRRGVEQHQFWSRPPAAAVTTANTATPQYGVW